VRVAGGARRVERLETDVALQLDVTDVASCERFVADAVGQLGGVDILINNAGLALGRAPFDASSEEDERTVFETDVNGLVRMTRLCLPHIRDGGHIVNLGSIAGRQAYANAAVYVASKFAVRGFTYALREDLLGRPIRLTTVDPGLVESNFSRVRFRGDEEKAKAPYARVLQRGHPLPLGAEAEDERRTAASALLRQGRVLLGCVLHAQPARRRARAGRGFDPARALRRRVDAGRDRGAEPEHGAAV